MPSTTWSAQSPCAQPAGAGALLVRRLSRLSLAWLVTLGLGAVIVFAARWGPDWPAQLFRAGSVHTSLFVAWTDQWYAGQPMAGYSLLYPLTAHVLGAGLTGLLAATVSAWAVGHLAPVGDAVERRWYEAAAAIPLCTGLVIGQVPFLVGVAFGVLALWSLRSRHAILSAALALCAALASPLAGAFVVMLGVALTVAQGWRRGAPLAAAALGLAVCALAGGASGPFPCPWTSAGAVIVLAALVWIFTDRHDRLLRAFAVCYAAAAIACFVIADPVGGNVGRLGKLVAVPLLTYLLLRRRGELSGLACVRALGRSALRREPRACLAVLTAVIALVWSVQPAYDAITRGSVDPSRQASYYAGLLGFLRTQDPGSGRLEIPFTKGHWEATYVAEVFPLARGWERQSDLHYNAVLYDDGLTAAAYHAWLAEMSVVLVALPDASIDYGGRSEATLLEHPPAYLQPVWHDAHWRVFRVAGAAPMVTGPARLRDLDATALTVTFSGPGTALIRVHDSNLWSVTRGSACLQPTAPDHWLRVYAPSAGTVTLGASVGLPSARGPCPAD